MQKDDRIYPCHPHGVRRDALVHTCGNLHTLRHEVLGVTGGLRVELAEALQVVELRQKGTAPTFSGSKIQHRSHVVCNPRIKTGGWTLKCGIRP